MLILDFLQLYGISKYKKYMDYNLKLFN